MRWRAVIAGRGDGVAGAWAGTAGLQRAAAEINVVEELQRDRRGLGVSELDERELARAVHLRGGGDGIPARPTRGIARPAHAGYTLTSMTAGIAPAAHGSVESGARKRSLSIDPVTTPCARLPT